MTFINYSSVYFYNSSKNVSTKVLNYEMGKIVIRSYIWQNYNVFSIIIISYLFCNL